MSKPRDDRQKDLLLPALDQIIDMGHPLVRLAALIDWNILDDRFSSVCQTGPGQPGLPTRLVAGLFILKHMHNLSDEVLCARWIENPYYQYFCGELSFCHRLPFDRSSMTRWRQRLGEEQLVALIQGSLSVAHKTGAIGPKRPGAGGGRYHSSKEPHFARPPGSKSGTAIQARLKGNGHATRRTRAGKTEDP
jgi:transposase, IS5 family